MSPTRGARWTWIGALTAVAILLAVNVAGALLVRRARLDALRTAELEVRVDLAERARSLEGTLRASRAELGFLASSPVLAELPEALAADDPARVRFHRLGAEGLLLRYLEAHPEIERIFVRDRGGAPILAMGRRASFPVPIPLEAASRPAAPGRLRTALALEGADGTLVADVNPAGLLSSLATGTGRAVLLDASGRPLVGTPDAFDRVRESRDAAKAGEPPGVADWVVATAPVQPPSEALGDGWRLVRAERSDDLLAGLGSVVDRYRALLALEALAVVATLLLGAVAVRQARRRARLEEAAAQREALSAMEDRLHEVDRLASVGRMAATLAHEIRNPLEGMRNWLSLAEREAREVGSPRLLSHVGRVGEGIDTLAEVVRRVLALARPSIGTTESLVLNAVVEDAVTSVEGTRSFRTLRVAKDLDPALPAVRGDRVLLRQVLVNLLLNARDASPDGGVIRVTTRRSGTDVTVEVADRGPGISEEMVPHLFEPFASGKGSTGLGLSFCARVARVHSGRIEAGAAHGGVGARFTLTLPAEGAEPPAVEEAVS